MNGNNLFWSKILSNSIKILPSVLPATKLEPEKVRLFIGAYGFEQRSLGWVNYQEGQGKVLNCALVFKYLHPKGRNRIKELKKSLINNGVVNYINIPYDVHYPHNIEESLLKNLERVLPDIEEIVIDISAMTKLMILFCLCALSKFKRTVRIVYSR